MKRVGNPGVIKNEFRALLRQKTIHSPVEPEKGNLTRSKGVAVLQSAQACDSVQGKASEYTVKAELESIESVFEKMHPLIELTDVMKEEEENRNDVRDP